MTDPDIKAIADTIIYVAEERLKAKKYTSRLSAIYDVKLAVTSAVGELMAEERRELHHRLVEEAFPH